MLFFFPQSAFLLSFSLMGILRVDTPNMGGHLCEISIASDETKSLVLATSRNCKSI